MHNILNNPRPQSSLERFLELLIFLAQFMTFGLTPNIATTKFILQLVDFTKKLKQIIKSVLCSCMHPTKNNY